PTTAYTSLIFCVEVAKKKCYKFNYQNKNTLLIASCCLLESALLLSRFGINAKLILQAEVKELETIEQLKPYPKYLNTYLSQTNTAFSVVASQPNGCPNRHLLTSFVIAPVEVIVIFYKDE
ncbi:31729_t:CDS:2, partial [Gigaspora margarita]